MTRRGAVAGAVLSLLALAAVRSGGGGPPLYDGLCTPPTYVKLGSNPGPPSRSQTFSASDLASTFELADNDTAPQAQIIVAAGALSAPPGSTATVSITPVQPPAVKPADGSIDGNVYDFEVTVGGKRLQLTPNHLVTIVLTATAVGGADRQVEHFDGTRWTAQAKTVQSGCGSTYQANSTTLGIFALVVAGTGSSGPGAAGGGGSPAVVIIVVVVVILAVIIGALRLNRTGSRGRARGGGRRRR